MERIKKFDKLNEDKIKMGAHHYVNFKSSFGDFPRKKTSKNEKKK